MNKKICEQQDALLTKTLDDIDRSTMNI